MVLPTDNLAPADKLAEGLVARTTNITDNTAQEMIIVTRDKVELALHRNLPDYVPTGKLMASAGLVIALVTTLVTAEFKNMLGMPGETWFGVFLFAAVASVGLAVQDLNKWLRRPTLDDLVDSIERDSRDNSVASNLS